MTIKQLIEEKGKRFATLKELKQQLEETTDPVVAEEKMKQIEACDKEYEALEKQQRILEKENEREAAKAGVPVPDAVKTKEELDILEDRAVWDYLKNGERYMKPETKEILDAYRERTNAQSLTVGKGGYTVPAITAKNIETARLYFGGMLDPNFTQWIKTAAGEALTIPLADDTGNTGYLIAEATDQNTSASDIDLTTATLNAYKYTSGMIKISNELLQDTGHEFFIGWMMDQMTIRLFRALNTAFTQGTGSSQPQGIDGAATKGEDSLARSITRDNILNLLHSVDRSYRFAPSSAFMLNDSTLAAIKALAIGSADARPLWQPSFAQGEPSTIEGRPYLVNNDVSDIFPTYKPVFFGDWKKFLIREIGELRFIRVDELYAATDQIAISILGRYDSELGASDAPIKFIRCGVT